MSTEIKIDKKVVPKEPDHYTFMTPRWIYNMYYHHFPFTMLTTIESFLLHGFLLLFVFFIVFGIYSYLPTSLMISLSRGYYYIFGDEDLKSKLGIQD